MTSKDFIIWLKGFSEGVHQYNITPIQWETLKDELNKVDDTPYVSDNFTIGPDGAYERDPNQFPFGTPNGTGSPGFTVTTTPGTSYVTISNPNTFTTSTATSLPSGSTITYTTSTDKTLLHD